MKTFLIAVSLLATVAYVSAGCPAKFKKEGNQYVFRGSGDSCHIMYCTPKGVHGMGCATWARSRSICGDAKLQDEGCYNGDSQDKSKPYPGCCSSPKKFCKGDAGFDASKVPNVHANMRKIARC